MPVPAPDFHRQSLHKNQRRQTLVISCHNDNTTTKLPERQLNRLKRRLKWNWQLEIKTPMCSRLTAVMPGFPLPLTFPP